MEDAPRPRLAERIPRSARVSVGDATAEGWMLWNRVLALGRLGRDRDAEATSLAVVRRGLRDATWAGHVGFAAYGEARAGRLDAARAILEAAPADGGDRRRTLATLARVLAAALVDVGSASTPAEAAARLATRRREARAVASSLPATAPDDARRWDEATRALARAAGRRRPFSDRRIPGRGSRSSGWIWGALVALYVLIKVAQLLGRGPPRGRRPRARHGGGGARTHNLGLKRPEDASHEPLCDNDLRASRDAACPSACLFPAELPVSPGPEALARALLLEAAAAPDPMPLIEAARVLLESARARSVVTSDRPSAPCETDRSDRAGRGAAPPSGALPATTRTPRRSAGAS